MAGIICANALMKKKKILKISLKMVAVWGSVLWYWRQHSLLFYYHFFFLNTGCERRHNDDD